MVTTSTVSMSLITCSLLILTCRSAWHANGNGQDDLQPSFSEWCILHNKNYSSYEEAIFREEVFNQNHDIVKSLNVQYKERYGVGRPGLKATPLDSQHSSSKMQCIHLVLLIQRV